MDPNIVRHPAGPVIDTDTGAWGVATASFSADRFHRFRLSRVWDPNGPRVNFVMCNPSTADAFVLDPTVRRCMGYARSWGMGACEVTNIFALRSTDPAALYRATDPVGAGNDDAIISAATCADVVVAAWGTHGALLGRGEEVRNILTPYAPNILRLTKAGFPSHPLYLPSDITPTPW